MGWRQREDRVSTAATVAETWGEFTTHRFVVLTGGEPLLQVDDELIAALHEQGFEIAIETNGTLEPPAGIEWICVSPKADAELKLTRGNELKLIYPQAGAPPERFAGQAFAHFFLQPLDSPARAANTQAAIAYCLEHPQWRLSLCACILLFGDSGQLQRIRHGHR